jgi:hypothetical protein
LSMRLSRRQSHPALGPSCELQTYTCATCGNIQNGDRLVQLGLRVLREIKSEEVLRMAPRAASGNFT